MYLKDKTERLAIRLNKEQVEYLDKLSKLTGITKTDILRQYINKLMAAGNEHKQGN